MCQIRKKKSPSKLFVLISENNAGVKLVCESDWCCVISDKSDKYGDLATKLNRT